MIEHRYEPRKLQQIGFSFWLSLPKNWLIHHDLKKRSEVALTLNSADELVLSPARRQK